MIVAVNGTMSPLKYRVCGSFSAVIVATNGTMARMNTVHPAAYVAFKRWLAEQREREALKRHRDALQADAVQTLLDDYLPHLNYKAAAAP